MCERNDSKGGHATRWFQAAPSMNPRVLRQKRVTQTALRLRVLLSKVMFHEIDNRLMVVIRDL